MKRILCLMLLLLLPCAAWAKTVHYTTGGVQFDLPFSFEGPAKIGSGAMRLSYPSAKKPVLELIVHRVSAAVAKQIPGDLLVYEKTTFLGLSKPPEWTSQSTILGQSVEVGGQAYRSGVASSCLVPLKNGDRLFLALRTPTPPEKGQMEQVWAALVESLKD